MEWKPLLMFLLCFAIFVKGESGRFWSVTDIHHDWLYKEGGDIKNMCHGKSPLPPRASKFGEYLCDSPLFLRDSVFKFMKEEEPNPDFILWNGDVIAHLEYAETTKDLVQKWLTEFSEGFKSAFPGKRVIPSLGNHDTFPTEKMVPPKSFSLVSLSQIFFILESQTLQVGCTLLFRNFGVVG